MTIVPTFAYDANEEILYVGFANLRLDKQSEIDEVFLAVRQFWRAKCGGRKVYVVVDYTDFSLEIALTDYYAKYVKEAVEDYSITVVRYTEDVLVRASLRLIGITIHVPSNLYATKDEALKVVRALRSKRISLEGTE
jgi:hypothetical protein